MRIPRPVDGDTVRAVGLAAAAMIANLVAVAFTVVFTRLLGAEAYGSLAALLNVTVMLFVPGYALQVASARAAAAGQLGSGGELAATLERWTHQLVAAMLAVAVMSALVREQLAGALNVTEVWAAASIPVVAVAWLLLCLQRGLLQARRAYRAVGLSIVIESVARLTFGLLLVGPGGVTGAYLGTVIAVTGSAGVLAVVLRRRLGSPAARVRRQSLRELTRDAAVPIVALTLVAALQNVDVLVAKHVMSERAAGVYAAATVAGKATVWIAVGLGLWVLPEATRKAVEGRDPRQVLLKAFLVIGVVAGVALLAYAVVPRVVLRLAFGPGYESGASILFALGLAYALLAISYLAVQYLLALHRRGFTVVLGAAAAAMPAVLSGYHSLTSFALVAVAVQAGTAGTLVALSLSTRHGRDASGSRRPSVPGVAATDARSAPVTVGRPGGGGEGR